jgi:hypothetical protein
MTRKPKENQVENQIDKSDMLYFIELLQNAKEERNWDGVDETIEAMKECLDDDEVLEDD